MGFFSDLKTRRVLSDLTERMETIERTLKAVQLEWQDTYDRLRRLMGRVAKRALHDEAPVDPEHVEPTADNSTPTVAGAGLSQRQREIQQQILRHRAGMR